MCDVQLSCEGDARVGEEKLSDGRTHKDWDKAGSMFPGTPTIIGSVEVVVVVVVVLDMVLVVLLAVGAVVAA